MIYAIVSVKVLGIKEILKINALINQGVFLVIFQILF